MLITLNNVQKIARINNKHIKRRILSVLKYFKFSDNTAISITFVTKTKIRDLKAEYFNKPVYTDVIALGYNDGKRKVLDKNSYYADFLGDIIICPAVVKENSLYFGTEFTEELDLCIIHGILHLLGYSDVTMRGKARMNKMQKTLLTFE